MKKGLELIMAGMIALSSNAAAINPESAYDNQKSTQTLTSNQMNDPNGYLGKLKKNEYVVSSQVFSAYAKSVDDSPATFWAGGPAATCISENFLKGKRKKSFYKSIQELGYTKSDAKKYYSMFSTNGNIILNESELHKKKFAGNIVHERVHREQNALSEKEKMAILQTYDQLKDSENPSKPSRHFFDDKVEWSGFVTASIARNGNELMPYLIQGALEDHVLQTIKNKYPETYMIYEKLRERTELK